VKGKDGEQRHPLLVALQVGFALARKKKPQTISQKTENETTAGQRALMLL